MKQDAEILSQLLATMCATLSNPKPATPALLQGWLIAWSLQPDLGIEDIRSAVTRWISTNKWFPAPVEVLSIARSIKEDREREQRLANARIEMGASPALPAPPITDEQKREILERMAPGPRALLAALCAPEPSGKRGRMVRVGQKQ